MLPFEQGEVLVQRRQVYWFPFKGALLTEYRADGMHPPIVLPQAVEVA